MNVMVLWLCVSEPSWPHGLKPARLLCPWGFSRPEYWSGLPRPAPGNLPDPGIKLRSPTLWVGSLLTELPGQGGGRLVDRKGERVGGETEVWITANVWSWWRRSSCYIIFLCFPICLKDFIIKNKRKGKQSCLHCLRVLPRKQHILISFHVVLEWYPLLDLGRGSL